MRAIQPYFALSASKYYKRELTKHGISHIYEYKSDLSSDLHTLVVPDFLDGRFKDFLDNSIELEACLRKRDLIDRLNDAKTFLNKVEAFLSFYNDKI